MSESLSILAWVIVYWLFLLSPLIAAAAVLVRLRKRKQVLLKPALALLGPAAPWVAFLTYATVNRHPDGSLPSDVSPGVGIASMLVFYGTPLLAVVAVWFATGYRKAALLVGVLNTVVGMAIALLGIMMTSGNWI